MINMKKAMQIISDRRNFAELENYKLLKNLRKDKDYVYLENKISYLEFEIAKRETLQRETGALKKDLVNIKRKYKTYLENKNITTKDLNVNYTCKKCCDNGYIKECMCSCLEELLFQELKINCGKLETEISDFSKINFNIYDNITGYKNTFKQLKLYTENFPIKKPFLILTGKTGVGKSFMASVVCNVLMKKNHNVLFINSTKLNNLFLEYHLAKIENKQCIFEPLINCELLVIDDLGSENILNKVTINYLYQLLINRYEKNTIITTNLDNKIF